MLLLGLIGYPLRHSVSPPMHQSALEHLGIAGRYEAWETPPHRLAERVAQLRSLGVAGFNVTVPHKEAIIPLLDALEGDAPAVGAVNTVVRAGHRLIGHNTDAPGFLEALRRDGGLDPRGRRALLLGAGGSARAVAVALARAGVASIAVANRNPERARSLARALQPLGVEVTPLPLEPGALAPVARGADIIVNCTPVGMAHGPAEGQTPLPGDLIPPRSLVFDLVYNPLETPLLREARRAGARAVGGLPMLVYQGALAFRLWTGREPPVGVMLECARRHLA